MKKIASMFLAIVFILCVCILNCSAAEPDFYCKKSQGAQGESVTLTIGIKDRVENVGGLCIYVTYNEAELTYVAGSMAILNSNMKNGDINPDNAALGKASVIWNSYKGADIEGDIVSLRFNIKSSSSSLKVQISEMFYNDSSYTDVISKPIVITPEATGETNEAVNAVIAKINAIGTVENTDASKAKIDAAREAYNALTTKEKNLVTNYSVLTAAEIAYQEMQNESDLKSEVNSWLDTHSSVLTKTVDTVASADEAAVKSAITTWGNLSTNAKVKLVTEKNLLNALLKKVEELKLSEQEKAEMLEEAKGYLAEFKNTYGALLNINLADVDSNYYEAFYNAKNALAEYIDMNSMFADTAKNEIKHITECYEKALKLKSDSEAIINPDAEAAKDFQTKYGWILGMKTDQVSYEDLADLSVAAYAYSLLSNEAKSLLPGAEEHISSLISHAESIAPQGEIQTVEKIVEVEKVVEKEIEKQVIVKDPGSSEETSKQTGVLLNAIVSELNPIVWWLIGSAAMLTVICFALAFLYFKSKSKREVREVWEN